MIQTLKLLIPALIPSWRFFDTITASPRIEFALLKAAEDTPGIWQEFRPRPEKLSIITMLKRMIYNSRWNESLFVMSCAERIMENPTQHSQQEILGRITTELKCNDINAAYIKFRLVFISRNIAELQKDVMFISPAHPLLDGENP